MRIFMKYKITALWVIVGMLGTNATECDVMLPQNFFNICFNKSVEKFRNSDIARETLPIGNGVEAMEVKSFAIKGLNDIEMEYDESRKELRFKNKSISDITTSTDYSSIDFNKITKLVFDGIDLNVDTVMLIRYFLFDNLKISSARISPMEFMRKIMSIEFTKYQSITNRDYLLVIQNLARYVNDLKIDGNMTADDLINIADVVRPNYEDNKDLTIYLLSKEVNKEELDKTVAYLSEECCYNIKLEYNN